MQGYRTPSARLGSRGPRHPTSFCYDQMRYAGSDCGVKQRPIVRSEAVNSNELVSAKGSSH